MKRYLVAAGVLALAACAPDIEHTEAPNQVVARFDPSQTPPVVPTPNDLAADPTTGQLAITPAPGASDIDVEFTSYLNQLNGFPASSTANETFTAKLDPASVTAQTVRVYDVTANYAPVTDAKTQYTDTTNGQAPGSVDISRTVGWTPGHSYLIAVVGGDNGVKGAGGEKVVGSSTWALIRSEQSLVTCTDLTSADCKSTTSIIPATGVDPAAQEKDRNSKAVQLEQLRLKYKPTIEKLIADGIARQDIAVAWSFRISDDLAMAFDPAAATPVVPLPNDLAIDPTTGLVNAPIDPTASAANQEFTRDYVNSLNGFPVVSPASALVAGGDLNPTTVTTDTVLVTDLTPGVTTQPVVTVSYDSAAHEVVFPPPAGGWLKGHEYGAVVIGGANGVKGTDGKDVVASTVWALARSKAPIAECDDPADPSTCTSLFTISPLSNTQAGQLEQVRSALSPFLDALEAEGIPRSAVAVGWTFRIMNHPEANFALDPVNPANSIIPFPNDILKDPTTGLLKLPVPPGGGLQAQLVQGLNTLNGWSLSAPIVSENSATQGPLTDDAGIDPATLSVDADGGTTVFIKLTPGGLPPLVQPCVDCAVSHLPDGGRTGPETFEFAPLAPLSENSAYAAAIKTSVKDTDGRPVAPTLTFALLRMENSLLDANGDPTVDGVSKPQATALEQLRLGLKPVIDGLVASGTPRKELALAWAFSTETVVNGKSTYPGLRELHGLPSAVPTTLLPTTVDYLTDITSNIPAQFNPGNSVKFYQGSFHSIFMLTDPRGVFTTSPTNARFEKVPFTLATPVAAPTGGGNWPVVIFSHGLQGYRNQSLAIVPTLTSQGYAVIFMDVVFHGDRTSCVGIHTVLGQAIDDVVCANPTTQKCDNTSAVTAATYGFCVPRAGARATACTNDVVCNAASKGRCLSDGFCEDADFSRDPATGAPAVQNPTTGAYSTISGWNIINTTNLFATRDNFRQQVIDLAQFARVIAATGTGSLNATLTGAPNSAPASLDATKLNYAGISLGGILGTLYVAAAPEIHRAVLNVAGGDPTNILLTSPAFAAQRAGFLATLAGQGINVGTPAFDQFVYFAHTILDPADPQNAGYDLENAANVPSDRETLIQYISGDAVVPNTSTATLIAAATRAEAAKRSSVYQFNFTTTEVPVPSRHGFLLNFVNPTNLNPSPTLQAQTQLVTFLKTGLQP